MTRPDKYILDSSYNLMRTIIPDMITHADLVHHFDPNDLVKYNYSVHITAQPHDKYVLFDIAIFNSPTQISLENYYKLTMPRCYLHMAQRIGINKDPDALMQLDLRGKAKLTPNSPFTIQDRLALNNIAKYIYTGHAGLAEYLNQYANYFLKQYINARIVNNHETRLF